MASVGWASAPSHTSRTAVLAFSIRSGGSCGIWWAIIACILSLTRTSSTELPCTSKVHPSFKHFNALAMARSPFQIGRLLVPHPTGRAQGRDCSGLTDRRTRPGTARSKSGSRQISHCLLQLLLIERPMITVGVRGGGHGVGMGHDGPARKQDAGHRPKDGQSTINKGTHIHHRVHLLFG